MYTYSIIVALVKSIEIKANTCTNDCNKHINTYVLLSS